MASCADGTCVDPACPMCVELPLRFPPVQSCPGIVREHYCRLVRNHDGPCYPDHAKPAIVNVSRDGEAKPKASSHRMSRK